MTADLGVLGELEAVLADRLATRPEGSYTVALLTDPERTRRKIAEEAFELTLELGRAPVDAQRTAEEAADVLYHVLVGLVGAGVPLATVCEVLRARRSAGGTS